MLTGTLSLGQGTRPLPGKHEPRGVALTTWGQAPLLPEGDPMDPAAPLPTGTVTFLLTDIEGSTRLWEQQRDAMPRSIAVHDRLLRAAIDVHGGAVFKAMGDAF